MDEPPRPPPPPPPRPALNSAAATSWPELLAPFDLSRLRATLSSHPLTPRRLARLLALPLSPATSLLLLDWYASSHPALSLSSLPLRPILAVGAADPDRALALLDSLPRSRLPPLRESLLLPLLRSLPPGRALHLLDQMPRRFAVTPSFRSYNVVLSTLARADCHADALLLYRRMLGDRVPPTTFTFGVAARALCRLGRAGDALALLRGMARHGCVPDAVLYQTVIHALVAQGGSPRPRRSSTRCCSAVLGLCGLGRVREAARLVDRMMMQGCTPSAVTYGFLLRGLCRTRQVDEACAMLGRLPEVNVVILNTVIRGCLAEGKLARATELNGMWDEARAMLDQMSAKGFSMNSQGYNGIVYALGKDGKLDEAMRLVQEMKSQGCKPDICTYNTIIYHLCNNDQMDEAEHIFGNLLEEGVVANGITYNTLIHALLRSGRWQEGLRLANEMVLHGFQLDVISYNGLIKALCKEGNVDRSMVLLEEMMTKGIKPNNFSYNMLINELCKAGKVRDALELSKEMLNQGLTPDIVTYNTLINGLCKVGWTHAALNLLEKLPNENVHPDIITYNILISWHCKVRLLDDVAMLLDKAVSGGIVPNERTWGMMVQNFVRQPVNLEGY
ncbi:unnamed protein product [Miscanthus lutarioriparius]|uniref:Pentatricopeptide repeat-containing protein n=1 Tax=Miscanthus lutarioriparius TaxID=422564 RepID=A0A811NRS7_9POAL|nr:unnamed protein product [Miscanthus lutarioriparius]